MEYFCSEGQYAYLDAADFVDFLYKLILKIEDYIEEYDVDEDELAEIDEEYLAEDCYEYNFYHREGNEKGRFTVDMSGWDEERKREYFIYYYPE